jgi:hypothetical protein
MAAPNPITHPRLFNTFTVDNTPAPGLARIKSGGNRAMEYQEAQTPGEVGANLILRFQHVTRITYLIELWTKEHFAAWDAFIAPIMIGKDLRPPRVWQLQDPRVAHNKINLLVFTECSAQLELAPGKWGYELSFGEKPKQKKIGGPVKAPANAVEAKIAELSKSNASLQGKLDVLAGAKAKGK